MSGMIFFYPRDDTLKVLCWYLYGKCVKNRWFFLGLFQGSDGLLTRDLENMVILDFMDYLFISEGMFSICFISIYIYIRSVSKKGILRLGMQRKFRVPYRKLEGCGNPWCHGWSYLTTRKIAWKFCVDIFIMKYVTNWWSIIVYLEDADISDRWLGGHVCAWHQCGVMCVGFG